MNIRYDGKENDAIRPASLQLFGLDVDEINWFIGNFLVSFDLS
jgi:hypothetical protein